MPTVKSIDEVLGPLSTRTLLVDFSILLVNTSDNMRTSFLMVINQSRVDEINESEISRRTVCSVQFDINKLSDCRKVSPLSAEEEVVSTTKLNLN